MNHKITMMNHHSPWFTLGDKPHSWWTNSWLTMKIIRININQPWVAILMTLFIMIGLLSINHEESLTIINHDKLSQTRPLANTPTLTPSHAWREVEQCQFTEAFARLAMLPFPVMAGLWLCFTHYIYIHIYILLFIYLSIYLFTYVYVYIYT